MDAYWDVGFPDGEQNPDEPEYGVLFDSRRAA